RVELQGLERKVLEVRHGFRGRSASQYRVSKRQGGDGFFTLCASCATNAERGISRAPSDARCCVFCWQSIMSMPWCRQKATSAASAIFDASGTRVNIDS